MIIEFNSPSLKVNEETAKAIEKQVMKLTRLGEKISRVEIFLTEENSPAKENRNCKIRLDIYGDSLFAYKTAESFEKAATSVIKVLKQMLKEKTGQRNLPPDEVTTTIKV